MITGLILAGIAGLLGAILGAACTDSSSQQTTSNDPNSSAEKIATDTAIKVLVGYQVLEAEKKDHYIMRLKDFSLDRLVVLVFCIWW